LSLLEHVSPIGWDNILLYGEYVIDTETIPPPLHLDKPFLTPEMV
jgi:hypothetical protein